MDGAKVLPLKSLLSVRLTAGGLILLGMACLWISAGHVRIGDFYMEISRTAPPYVRLALIAFSLLILCVGMCVLIAQEINRSSDRTKAFAAVFVVTSALMAGFSYWLFLDRPNKNVIARWSYEYGNPFGELMLNTDQLRKYVGHPLVISARCSNPGADDVDCLVLSHWTPDETSAKVTIPMPRVVSNLRLGDEVEYSVYVIPAGTVIDSKPLTVNDLIALGADRLTYRNIDVSISRVSPAAVAQLVGQMSADEREQVFRQVERQTNGTSTPPHQVVSTGAH